MNSKDEFHPIDRQGNELDWINCNFNSQGICSIKINQYGEDAEEYYLSRSELSRSEYWKKIEDFSPKILFHKGAKKLDVNQRLIESLKEAVLKLNIEIENIKKIIETGLAQLKKELETPFVSKSIRNIALESIEDQLQGAKLRRQDCERLKKINRLIMNQKSIKNEIQEILSNLYQEFSVAKETSVEEQLSSEIEKEQIRIDKWLMRNNPFKGGSGGLAAFGGRIRGKKYRDNRSVRERFSAFPSIGEANKLDSW